MSVNYCRSVEELRVVASNFWLPELARQEAELSIIPRLLETQDAFIAILSVPVPSIEGLFAIVEAAMMPANLFLKHLMVIADFGGEYLQRINTQFVTLFPEEKLRYVWLVNGKLEEREYMFQTMPTKGVLDNDKIGVSGRKLLIEQTLSKLHQDVIVLLLVGRASIDEVLSNILSKCEISDYLGQPEKLSVFIRQRYLWVSRITGGSQSNNLGQLAQQFVRKHLMSYFADSSIQFLSNGHLPGVRHTDLSDQRETTFDLVAAYKNKFVAVEVSFQVTTNSVIERKSGQAQARYEQVHAAGYKIAYVLDGAGNFQRESALRTICTFSDCTVAW